MRKRLFEIIELSDGNDKASRIYDLFMMYVIIVSLIPLAFKETNILFIAVDYISAAIFVVDYLLRFATADYKLKIKENKKGKKFFEGVCEAICHISLHAHGYH